MLQATISHLRNERFHNLASAALEKLHSAGGFTLRASNGDSAPNSGYVVSLLGQEEKHRLADISAGTIGEYFANRPDTIDYFGGWVENGIVFLDVCAIVPSLETALELAKQNRQKAIYDLRQAQTLYVDTIAHNGHFADSGIQVHSAGPIFPLHIVATVNFTADTATYRAEGLGANLPAFSFRWSDVSARRLAHQQAHDSAAKYLRENP